MYEAYRLLWHKTRRRALHYLRWAPMSGEVVACYAAMCNQQDPMFSRFPCDWRIAKATTEHFRDMITEKDTAYMSVLVGELLKKRPVLEKDFFMSCAPLGRSIRCRDFVVNATRFYRSWKKAPEDELFDCPFPPEIQAQGQALFPELLEFLLEWSLPRLEAIEEAFRARILSDEYCTNLCFSTLVKRTGTDLQLTPRYGPPLPILLPAVARLRIQRALEQYARSIADCPDNEEQREAVGEVLGETLYKILHHYRTILHAHDLSERAVMLDIYHHDMPKGPEAILGKYVSFARARKM
jgi:hypothetical protein